MVAFRESRTAKNLLTSFAAEAQARSRYNFFADQARDDGFMQIGRLFDETAAQEQEHALRFFKFFNGGELEIQWSFPAGVIKDTHANLIASAELEFFVHDSMYKGFAVVAREEGFERAADTLDAISVAEKNHEKLFRELAENIAANRTFVREEEKVWRCLNCGYLHTGKLLRKNVRPALSPGDILNSWGKTGRSLQPKGLGIFPWPFDRFICFLPVSSLNDRWLTTFSAFHRHSSSPKKAIRLANSYEMITMSAK